MKTAEQIFYEIFKRKPYSDLELKIIKAMETYANQFKTLTP